MDMNAGSTAVEQVREYLHMHLRIGAHGPTFRHCFQRNLSFGAVLNSFRITNIEVGLPGLRTETPEFRRLIQLAFATHYNVLLNKDRHWGGIFTSIRRSLLKFSFVLLPGLGVGNESIGVLSAATHCLRSIARH